MKWRYWRWFFFGLSGRPGISKFLNWWLVGHIAVGLFLTHYLQKSLEDQATALILPLAGIFIGLTFAWSGNAQALMQADELAEMFERNADGLENYIYTFQTAVLCLLVTIVGWGLVGLGLQEQLAPTKGKLIDFFLFFLSSISVRECWHVIMGSQFFVLALRNIKKMQKSD